MIEFASIIIESRWLSSFEDCKPRKFLGQGKWVI
jgi:hypothetical protein